MTNSGRRRLIDRACHRPHSFEERTR